MKEAIDWICNILWTDLTCVEKIKQLNRSERLSDVVVTTWIWFALGLKGGIILDPNQKPVLYSPGEWLGRVIVIGVILHIYITSFHVVGLVAEGIWAKKRGRCWFEQNSEKSSISKGQSL